MIEPLSDSKILKELEESLRIDEHNLDQAIVRHPEHYYRVSQRLVIIISQRDAAKQELEETEARIDAQLRDAAYKADEKITEREIASNKVLNKDVTAASLRLHDFNLLVGKFTAMKDAFQQRSYMLRALCDLYAANYYGADIHGKTASDIRHESGERAKQRMNEGRKEQWNPRVRRGE